MYFYVINNPIKLPNLHVIVYILNEANDNFSINKKKTHSCLACASAHELHSLNVHVHELHST